MIRYNYELPMIQLTKDATRHSQLLDNNNKDIQSQFNDFTLQDFLKIFSVKENEEKEDDLNYYTLKTQSEESKKSTEILSKKNIFNISTISQCDNSIQLTKKKRGKKVKNNNEKKQKVHDKNATDNLLRKVQVHYQSFIVSFINEILKALNYKQRFLKLDYRMKKNVKNNYFQSLKEKNLSYIINNNISAKYKNRDINTNRIIYEGVKDNIILKNIFNENYLVFFNNYYYKSVNIINLRKYGLNKIIILPKEVKMYKDLIEANKNSEEEYIHNINECVCINYLSNNLFLVN